MRIGETTHLLIEIDEELGLIGIASKDQLPIGFRVWLAISEDEIDELISLLDKAKEMLGIFTKAEKLWKNRWKKGGGRGRARI